MQKRANTGSNSLHGIRGSTKFERKKLKLKHLHTVLCKNARSCLQFVYFFGVLYVNILNSGTVCSAIPASKERKEEEGIRYKKEKRKRMNTYFKEKKYLISSNCFFINLYCIITLDLKICRFTLKYVHDPCNITL